MNSYISPLVVKRTNKELEYFIEHKYLIDNISQNIKNIYKQLSFVPVINNTYNDYRYHIQVYKNKEFIINIEFPNDYPFKSPTIYTCHLTPSYLKYKRYIVISIMDNLKKYPDYRDILNFYYICLYQKHPLFLYNNCNCFCCNSFTCPINWNPGIRITNVILEYFEIMFIKENMNIKKYILNKLLYDTLVNTYLKGNQDLLSHIFSFILL